MASLAAVVTAKAALAATCNIRAAQPTSLLPLQQRTHLDGTDLKTHQSIFCFA